MQTSPLNSLTSAISPRLTSILCTGGLFLRLVHHNSHRRCHDPNADVWDGAAILVLSHWKLFIFSSCTRSSGISALPLPLTMTWLLSMLVSFPHAFVLHVSLLYCYKIDVVCKELIAYRPLPPMKMEVWWSRKVFRLMFSKKIFSSTCDRGHTWLTLTVVRKTCPVWFSSRTAFVGLFYNASFTSKRLSSLLVFYHSDPPASLYQAPFKVNWSFRNGAV